jgi:hypothetical protein
MSYPPPWLKVTIASLALVTLLASEAAADPVCSSDRGTLTKTFPAGVSPEAILKIAGLGPEVCGAVMREWPRAPGTFILYSESPAGFAVHVLERRDQTFAVVGSTREDLGEVSFEDFDFAPYTIRKDQVAFGIRFEAHGPTKGGSWKCGSLSLFALMKGKLQPLLSTRMSYSAEGNDVAYDIDTGFSDEASATILVGRPDKSGYNTLIKKVGRRKYVYSFSAFGYSGPDEPACLEKFDHCFCPD